MCPKNRADDPTWVISQASPVLDYLLQTGEQRSQVTVDESDLMEWPVPFPAEMSAGTTSVRSYNSVDAVQLFESVIGMGNWARCRRVRLVRQVVQEVDESGEVGCLIVIHREMAAIRAVQVTSAG